MNFKHTGFSLTEVLMAVGILAVGLLLVATMFPAAIYMTTVASERTMAAIVADEAFAKIQIYDMNGITPDPDPCSCHDWGDAMFKAGEIAESEFEYPPVDPNGGSSQYYWSALYRKTPGNAEDKEYQIIVFVARKMNPGLTYESGSVATGRSGGKTWPMLLEVEINNYNDNTLTIKNANDENLVNPPATIVDNKTGKLYAIVKRDAAGVTLDRNWEDTSVSTIWLLPPSKSGGKNAGVEVYQRIIKF